MDVYRIILDVWPISLKTGGSEDPAIECGFFATRYVFARNEAVAAEKAKRRIRDWLAKTDGMNPVSGVELTLEIEEAETGYPLWALLRRTGGCTLYPIDEEDDTPGEG